MSNASHIASDIAPRIAIVIPARYGSSRFPGKPLAKLGDQSMLSMTVNVARKAADTFDNVHVLVATEDQRIADHAKEIGVECALTSDACKTGSDRALEAIKTSKIDVDFVLNLQGDAPFTPPEILVQMIHAFNDSVEVITPVHQLGWDDLDRLRENKKTTPFSGTTCVRDESGKALWFSKNIIPAIRKEDSLRASSDQSPVYQHIGLYGYSLSALEKFCSLPESHYEKLEGLEQLRFIENGISIQTLAVDFAPGQIQSGIDTPEDLERANKRLAS